MSSVLSDDEIDRYVASGALLGVSVPAAPSDRSRAVAWRNTSERPFFPPNPRGKTDASLQ